MFADDRSTISAFCLPAVGGAFFPVFDCRLDFAFTGDSQFVHFLYGDHLGWRDGDIVVEQHLIGNVGEVPVPEDVVGSISASCSAVECPAPEASRRYTTSPDASPYSSSARSIASLVNCSTTFTGTRFLFVFTSAKFE